MPRGRRRKIEVPTDTQPQFELGDTAEDIEKRRREREERDEREREERTRGEGQREDTEREEGREFPSLPCSKSPQRPSAATASVLDTSRDTESEMEISMASDVTHQPSRTSPK